MSLNLGAVFGHFQNLNLLTLLEDLRAGRTARQSWSTGSLLCPVAHGMPEDVQVQTLQALGQTAEFHVSCNFAAYYLSADTVDVQHFVDSWDHGLSSESLLHGLEEMWEERLADADAMQAFLQAGPGTPEDARVAGETRQPNNSSGEAASIDARRTCSTRTSSPAMVKRARKAPARLPKRS